MTDISISLETVLWLCGAIGTIAAAYKIISKPFKDLQSKFSSYDEMLANDKNRLDELQDLSKSIKTDLECQSDMIYQILDHMATNNNTGGMKKALDDYNKFYRKKD